MNLLRFFLFTSLACTTTMAETPDQTFEKLANRFVDQFPALSPVNATTLGDHRYDGDLDEISDEGRAKAHAMFSKFQRELNDIPRAKLSRANQVDHALLSNYLEDKIWRIDELQEWAWNPLAYTRLCGSAVYGLMAREFAPEQERLVHVAERLEQFPRLYTQIRATLDLKRVPRIHAEKAIQQNRGVISILDNVVVPRLAKLTESQRKRLLAAMKTAREAIEKHQRWLESDLLPNANGDFRLGRELYKQKLAYTLRSSQSLDAIRDRAFAELRRVREQMYEISTKVYKESFPYTQFPAKPDEAYQQAIIRACLEMAYQDLPARGEIVDTARESLKHATEFVRKKDFITIPPDPINIIVMPEFQRGVTLAYCDSPGALDVGQKTFYAVAPLPNSWTDKQVRSYLREYNVRSVHNLTIHEAMPGHFVQLAHSNRYKSKLRAVLSSGAFIEGWAVYTEQVMINQGYLNGDPLMHLIVLKWYLRAVANAILDQAIHTDGISRDEAMHLMMEQTFQEEREAAGKWVRAQLTSAQLSTYFVGYIEHTDLRREAEQTWGKRFDLKTYHDRVLSFGSPPVQFVRALLLDKEIPE